MRVLRDGSRFRSASESRQSGAGKRRNGRGQKRKQIGRAAKRGRDKHVMARRVMGTQMVTRAMVKRVDPDKERNVRDGADAIARGSVLEVEGFHPAFGVTLACCCSFRRRGIDATEIVFG